VDLFAKLLQFSELTDKIAQLLWAVRHLLFSKLLPNAEQLNRDVIDVYQTGRLKNPLSTSRMTHSDASDISPVLVLGRGFPQHRLKYEAGFAFR
jgi:hypothetical protein